MFADLAARTQLGADRSNLVGAYKWAASKSDWANAARLLLGAFTIFCDYPIECIELTIRSLDRLLDDERDLAMRLDSNLWMVHVMVSDIPSAMDTARHLRDSPEALHQAHGWMTVAFHVGVLDPDRASQILERAHDALQVVAAGPDRVLATGYCEHISSSIALHRSDLRTNRLPRYRRAARSQQF